MATVAHESEGRRLAADVSQRRPYTRHLPVLIDTSYCQEVQSGDYPGAAGQVSSLTNRIMEYRRQIKIRAAYQLLGTTLLYPCLHFEDEHDILSLRIDVSIHGSYVACHYLCFELQAVDDNDDTTTRFQLQFKQHTLPKHAACMDILVQEMGISLTLGPWQVDRVDYNALVLQLQRCSELLHRFCYAHAIREQAVTFLRQSPSQIDGVHASHYSVEQIRTNADQDSITFILHLAVGPGAPHTLRIEILYEDPNQTLPTHVAIHHLHSPRGGLRAIARSPGLRDVSSDDEEEADSNARALLSFAKSTFRTLTVPKAIDALVAHMITLAQDDAESDEIGFSS